MIAQNYMPKQYSRPPEMADDHRAPESTRHLAPTAREDLKQDQEEDVLEEQQTLVADSAKGERTAEAAVTAELRSTSNEAVLPLYKGKLVATEKKTTNTDPP